MTYRATSTRLRWAALAGTAFGIAALVLSLTVGARADLAANKDGGNPVIVELFTSQGCNTCPPADAYLGELAKREDIIALSFHVNYWDYIGWPDPFASEVTTQRQRDYGKSLSQRYVYTPEMIVDGRAHNSSTSAIEGLIAKGRSQAKLDLAFGKDANGRHIIAIPEGSVSGEASVWLVFYDTEHTTEIPRGENRGRSLSYHNVVRDIMHIGTYDGGALEIPISMAEAKRSGRGGCVVIVQENRTGPILGAAKIAF